MIPEKIKMSGACVRTRHLASLSLTDWLATSTGVYFRHMKKDKEQELLKAMWMIANPGKPLKKKK